MFAAHTTVQEVEHARAALVLIALGVVIFWRVVLRVVLAIIAIAVVAMVGAGAYVLLHVIHG